MQPRQVRTGLLNGNPVTRDLCKRVLQCIPDFRFHRSKTTEVTGKRNPDGAGVDLQCILKRYARLGQVERMSGIETGYCIKEQGRVTNIPCHRPIHRLKGKSCIGRSAPGTSGAGSESHDRAETGRRAQRTGQIGAMAEPELPGGEHRRRTA